MIESNILGAAVGIQNQGVIDKSEGTSLPSTVNAVIVGSFKRGRMDQPFTVTRENYKAILGHDPSNPSYLAVEDVFSRGISELSIVRTGSSGGSNTPIVCTPTSLEFVPNVTLPIDKEQIILRIILEVDGVALLNHNGNEGFADISLTTSQIGFIQNRDSPQWIANHLFLYSGIDLMRQMNLGKYFNYQPYSNLGLNQPITISGLATSDMSDEFSPSKPTIPASVKLTFKVIDNLPSNAVDFTLVQWGQDMSIYGCAIST